MFKEPLLPVALYQTMNFPETKKLLVAHSVSRAPQAPVHVCYGMNICLRREVEKAYLPARGHSPLSECCFQ